MDKFFSEFYSNPYMLLSLLSFAVAVVILYVVGLKKEQNQQKKLTEMMLNNGAIKVVKYLKTNEKITKNEMVSIVSNVKASEFYSKKKAKVTNKREYTSSLIDYMLNKKLIVKNDKWYLLNK